ncbi:MAG: 2-oxoacid:ferredoxin oxidoreductase subunit beta, partial [Sphingomonadaceae bacterium]|nr:2-oxoacid:ferredoxin oxidoreductase subunit beta [Sphingomonadaceae bacterium]
AGARLVARGIDVHKRLPEVLKAAHAHKGAAFIEIYQNCIVYNDDVFGSFTDKANAATGQLWVEHGKPLLFAGGTRGLGIDRDELALCVLDVADGDWEGAGVVTHDRTNRALVHMLVEMKGEGFPVALGVLYDDPRATFESEVVAQNAEAAKGKAADLNALIAKTQTWQVEKQPHVI